MHHEEKIQDLFEKVERIFGQLENIRIQQARDASDRESEKTTIANRHAAFDKQISELKDLIYNRDTGLAFEIDRMLQKERKREEIKKQILGLWISVFIMALKIMWDLITKP